MRNFFKRLFCRHRGAVWDIQQISYDGATVIKCRNCGKIKWVPL